MTPPLTPCLVNSLNECQCVDLIIFRSKVWVGQTERSDGRGGDGTR